MRNAFNVSSLKFSHTMWEIRSTWSSPHEHCGLNSALPALQRNAYRERWLFHRRWVVGDKLLFDKLQNFFPSFFFYRLAESCSSCHKMPYEKGMRERWDIMLWCGAMRFKNLLHWPEALCCICYCFNYFGLDVWYYFQRNVGLLDSKSFKTVLTQESQFLLGRKLISSPSMLVW